MAKPKIVVAHVSSDTAFANWLAYDLEAARADARTFPIDVFENVDHKLGVDGELPPCDWVIVVLSQRAVSSGLLQKALLRTRLIEIIGMIFIKGAPLDANPGYPVPWEWDTNTVLDATSKEDYDSALKWIVRDIGLAAAQGTKSAQHAPALPRMSVAKTSQQVFISYRRDDSAAGYAGHLRADLVYRYGEANVFMDLSIEPGVDFVDTLEDAVGSCAVLLAVIGRNWLTVTDAKSGKRRLDNPMDWVRVEIATALKRNVRVIPVLFHGAHMPIEDDLPDDLKQLARRQALEISDTRWDYDVDNLLTIVDKILDFKVPGNSAQK
jgi:TIR domain